MPTFFHIRFFSIGGKTELLFHTFHADDSSTKNEARVLPSAPVRVKRGKLTLGLSFSSITKFKIGFHDPFAALDIVLGMVVAR